VAEGNGVPRTVEEAVAQAQRLGYGPDAVAGLRAAFGAGKRAPAPAEPKVASAAKSARADVYSLEDLLQRPELLAPPVTVLPHFGWRARLSMIAMLEKRGKSTLIGQGVATAVMGGEFLGAAVRAITGTVLWFCIDEPLPDLVRRLREHGATGRVVICTRRVSGAELEAMITEYGAVLVIIDTLTEFCAGAIEDAYRATEWQGLLATLRGIFQRTQAAGVLLHHTTRDGKRYRDSGQLGAGVDQIITITVDPKDDTVRQVDSRGRVTVERFRLSYADDRYDFLDGDQSLEVRVARIIQAEPGISNNRLRLRVGGKAAKVDAAVESLVAQGAVVDDVQSGNHAYSWVGQKRSGTTPGTTPGRPPLRPAVSPLGRTRDEPGTTNGTTPHRPTPITGMGRGLGEGVE
jgi:hypothetical protein